MNRLTNKNILITGGNSGIGLAAAPRNQSKLRLLFPWNFPMTGSVDRLDEFLHFAQVLATSFLRFQFVFAQQETKTADSFHGFSRYFFTVSDRSNFVGCFSQPNLKSGGIST